MKNLYKLLSLFFVILLSAVRAYGQEPIEMADLMRSNGKIYVVVAVVGVVLAGLIVYVIMVDRKISRLEKMMREKK